MLIRLVSFGNSLDIPQGIEEKCENEHQTYQLASTRCWQFHTSSGVVGFDPREVTSLETC